MKRAPFVIGATGVGVGLLLSFHTRPIHLSGVSSAATSPPGTDSGGGSPSTAAGGGGTSATTAGPATGGGASSTTAAATRSATGPDVQYQYGDIQLRVTEKGSSITRIQVVSEGATDPRSAQINAQAVPMLQQQAISAQSANIDGVSGATFTSMAYQQALQSALDRMK